MQKFEITGRYVLDYLTRRFNEEKAKCESAIVDAARAVHQRRAQMYLEALTIVGTVDQDSSLVYVDDSKTSSEGEADN